MARDRILQIYRGTTAQNNAFTGAQGELTMDTDRKEIRIHDGSTAGGNVVGLTPGFIAPFAGSTAPDGWLVCDGSAISRTRYADLFAVIGTTYGSGDGNTTFNLPDISDCFIQGGTPGTTHNAGLPDITGSLRGSAGDTSVFTGAFKWLSNLGGVAGGGWSSAASVDFAASYSNSVYGNSTTVQPKSVEMKYCIKF